MNRIIAIAILATLAQSPAVRAAETLIAGTGGSPPVIQSSFVALFSTGNQYATSFTVPAGTPYDLTELQLAAYHYPTTPGLSATFSINLDEAGIPGTPLISFDAAITGTTEADSSLSFIPSTTVLLEGGQKYWIVGRATSSQVNWLHAFNQFGETAGPQRDGPLWVLNENSNVPAFAVLGVAVPEPSACLLGVVALVVFPIRRRRPTSHNRV